MPELLGDRAIMDFGFACVMCEQLSVYWGEEMRHATTGDFDAALPDLSTHLRHTSPDEHLPLLSVGMQNTTER